MNFMTDNELKIMLIQQYTNLQRIKKANGNHKNDGLEYQIKSIATKLSVIGVTVDDLTL